MEDQKYITERRYCMDSTKNYQTPQNFDTKNSGIAYGELTELEYYSKTTGNTRKCYVYTPPE